ncbi:unnamed protein product, partial [marine sediment metagenome]
MTAGFVPSPPLFTKATMRIAIYDLDKILFFSPKTFPNYALMKISNFHKQKGDEGE